MSSAVDRRHELRQGVQPGLDLSPVVVRAPVANQFLQLGELHALRPIGDGLLVGPAGFVNPSPQVRYCVFGHLDAERSDRCVFGRLHGRPSANQGGVGNGRILARYRRHKRFCSRWSGRNCLAWAAAAGRKTPIAPASAAIAKWRRLPINECNAAMIVLLVESSAPNTRIASERPPSSMGLSPSSGTWRAGVRRNGSNEIARLVEGLACSLTRGLLSTSPTQSSSCWYLSRSTKEQRGAGHRRRDLVLDGVTQPNDYSSRFNSKQKLGNSASTSASIEARV